MKLRMGRAEVIGVNRICAAVGFINLTNGDLDGGQKTAKSYGGSAKPLSKASITSGFMEGLTL